MFLSIIIPIYNDEKFLAECLDSCLDQDFPKDDYEIICVDDGSTDRTPGILKEYADKYSNIRLMMMERHKGGRNVGYLQANGDYIWFVDHDDIIAPNALVDIFNAIRSDSSYDRIAFPYYEFYEELSPDEKKLMQDGKLVANAGNDLAALTLWSGVIRTAFLKAHNILPRSRRVKAAGEFWGIERFKAWGGDNICMEECFDCGMRTKTLTGRPLYHYRRHKDSQTINLSKEARDKREEMRLNAALLRGYLAYQLKQRYFSEREQNGRASAETTAAVVVKLRRSVTNMVGLPKDKWQKGVHLLREKDVFFTRKPPEYSYSIKAYLNAKSLKEKISPSVYALYYSYTVTGAKWLRFLGTFRRMAGQSPEFMQQYRKAKKRRDEKIGTGRISR